MDEAKGRGARVLLGGDLWDGILPGDRKRYDPSVLHPRLQGRADVLNAAQEWAEELLMPYAGIIDGIGVGNHETAVEKHSSYDLCRPLVAALNRRREDMGRRTPVQYLGYTSFIQYPIKGRASAVRNVARYTIWFTHGAGRGGGAGAALSKLGQASTYAAADVYWSGHFHQKAVASKEMRHCDKQRRVIVKQAHCVLTGAYLMSYGTQTQASYAREGRRSNYAADAGMVPGGAGGVRLVLHFDEPGFPSKVEAVQ
jgi:hypothetical protein